LAQFALWAVLGLCGVVAIGVLVFGLWPGGALIAAVAVYGAGVLLAALSLRHGFPHATLGLCNAVTLARLMAVAALSGALIAGVGMPWAVFTLAAFALTLDGLDGWLARREGRVSAFGARFDMEVDSALALVLALLAWQGGSAGVIVLILGVPRYGFVLAGLALPWLAAPLPERFSRKVVCVLQLAVLIALQLPFVGGALGGALATVAALALIWSFGRDIALLWRARR